MYIPKMAAGIPITVIRMTIADHTFFIKFYLEGISQILNETNYTQYFENVTESGTFYIPTFLRHSPSYTASIIDVLIFSV